MSAVSKTQGVEYIACVSGDRYLGKPEALIAAGIVTADQLPGQPGMPLTSATFVDGVRMDGRKAKCIRDSRWMQVTLTGNHVHVTKGIPDDERERRRAVERAEIEEMARSTPRVDIGVEADRAEIAAASAVLAEGDIVLAAGDVAVVTGSFKKRRVLEDDGEFGLPDGRRFNYRYGYDCRLSDGKEFFYPPGKVKLADGRASHLRLVPSRRAEPKVTWPFPVVHGVPV